MTFKQYRTIDVCLFITIYSICELAIIKVGTRMIDQPYIVSLMLVMLLIVLMRWGKQAIWQAVISAIVFVLIQQGDIKQIIVYLLGNLGCYLLAFPLEKIGKDKVTSSVFNCLVYVVAGFILMEVFRYLGILIMYQKPLSALVMLMTTDALTLVFSIVVILVVRKIDGLFMDQKTYLLNLQNEKEEEQEALY